MDKVTAYRVKFQQKYLGGDIPGVTVIPVEEKLTLEDGSKFRLGESLHAVIPTIIGNNVEVASGSILLTGKDAQDARQGSR